MKTMGKLMLLPLVLAAGACDEEPTEVETRNIVQVAADAGSFNTLIAAVQAAGLTSVLEGEGPFTVFAPTDAAFAALPAGTVEALLQDREALTEILTYHVVPGRITSAEITRAGGAQPTTVQGQRLSVEVVNGVVRVDGARVITADVEASNGVIHVIDRVILPNAAASAAFPGRRAPAVRAASGPHSSTSRPKSTRRPASSPR